MVLAEVPTILTDAGTAAVAIGAVVTTAGVLSRLRPVRWCWRQLVGAPLARWLAGQHEAALAPVKDRIDEVGTALVDHMAAEERKAEQETAKAEQDRAERGERQRELDAWRAGVDERLDAGTKRFDDFETKLDQVLAATGPPTNTEQ